MADPIRSGMTSDPAGLARNRPTNLAAQRAFFQAAGTETPQVTQPQVQKIPTHLPADPPTKILRPGSLLDIRI